MTLRKFITTLIAAAGIGVTQAADYYWIGGASGNWADGANWSLTEGGESAGAYPSVYESDTATIGTETTITLPSNNANVGAAVFNATVAIQGGKIHAASYSGTGKLVLNTGATLYASVAYVPVSVDLEVPAGASATASTSGNSKGSGYGFDFTAECALTGSGTLTFDSYRPSNKLCWDASGFSGKIAFPRDSQGRNNVTIRAENATNEAMAWEGENSGATDTGFITQAGTYKLGSLQGTVYMVNAKSSSTYAYVKDVLMEVGALNRDDVLDGQVSRSASRSGDGASIRKVGSGTLTSSVKGVNAYYLKEGTLKIASDDALSVKDDNKNPGTKLVFEGGTLQVSDAVMSDVSRWLAIGTSSAALRFDDEGNDWTWSTAIPDTYSGGLMKRGTGTLTLSAVPVYTGATVVEAGTLLVAPGTTITDLTVAEGAALGVAATTAYTEPTVVLTITQVNLSEGQTLESIIPSSATIGYEFQIDETTGAVTVMATRPPVTFTWTGAAGDNNWSTPANWQVGGSETTELPLAIDSVSFPTDATLVLDAAKKVKEVFVGGHLTVSGSAIEATKVSGEGTVTLGDNGGLNAYNEARSAIEVSVPVEVTAAFETPATVNGYWAKASSGGSRLNLTNVVLTGSGALSFKGVRATIQLPNVMSNFVGKITIVDDSSQVSAHRVTVSVTPSQVTSNQVWDVSNYEKNSDGTTMFFKGSSEIFRFGALSGIVNHGGSQTSYLKNTVEIGAREDVDSTLGGNYFDNGYPNLASERGVTIRKVGAGSTLNFSGSRIRAYELEAGVLNLTANASVVTEWTRDGGGSYTIQMAFKGGTLKLGEDVTSDPSAGIKNSTAAIDFDDEGRDHTWATALAASNVGGLTKKGAGTLTLTSDGAATPTLGYKGYTRVEGGKLAIAEGTHYTWDITSPVALANAVEGATPTGYGVGTAQTNWVYGVNSWSDATKTVDLTNLKTIDLTSVTEIAKGLKFVIMTAKAFQVNGAAMTKAQREAIVIKLADEVKEIAAAKGYALRIEGNNLVYAPRMGFIISFQ